MNASHNDFEKALEQAHLIPICFTSAKTGAGIKDLVHIMASLCPAPNEVQIAEFTRKDSQDAEERDYFPEPNPHGRVVAHVFKIINDPFVGKLGVFRVHQGTVRKDTQLFVDDGKKAFKVAAQHPKTRFLNCSLNAPHPLVRTYYPRTYEVTYLLGMLVIVAVLAGTCCNPAPIPASCRSRCCSRRPKRGW